VDTEEECYASDRVAQGMRVKYVATPTWNQENGVTGAITASFLKRTLVTSLPREAIVARFSCSLDVLRQEGGL
jgi:hypothetical protein